MKFTAPPSPRGTNNERLFLFHCPRGSTPEQRTDVEDCEQVQPVQGQWLHSSFAEEFRCFGVLDTRQRDEPRAVNAPVLSLPDQET